MSSGVHALTVIENVTVSLTLQKVLRSRLVIGWCRQLASCVLSLAKRGSYGSGAFAALVALMSVCV